jgi:chemotaxis protein MotC
MKLYLHKISICAAFLSFCIVHSALAGNPLQLRDTMRTIERLQDEVVAGDADAPKLSRQLMVQFETDLNATKIDQLSNSSNVFAVVKYLLSGGNPAAIEREYQNTKLEPEFTDLFDGALAYAYGDTEKASTKLASVKVEELPLDVGGRLLLIQAILVSQHDMENALSLLEKASTSMPGTIVDEAALRRCSAIAAKLNNFKKFDVCASKMIRDFQHSPYWKEFSTTFISYVTNFKEEMDHAFSNWLIPILLDLPVALQSEIYLAISKQSVETGNFVLASLCASRATILSHEATPDFNRGMLYSGASFIGLKQNDLAAVRLGQVNASLLNDDDALLLKKAQDMLEQIKAKAIENNDLLETSSFPVDDQVERFNTLLMRADRMLKSISFESALPK